MESVAALILFGIVGFVAIVVLNAWLTTKRNKERRRLLSLKYPSSIVDRIMSGSIWVGQNEEMLGESLGEPVDIDQKVMKTKRREVWKYHHRGGNRYGLRITVENGEVSRWDEKL